MTASALRGDLLIAFTFIALLLVSQCGRPAVADAATDEFVVVAAQTEVRFWPSVDDFVEHMSQRVEAAMEHDPDLIVFPEDIGLPLIALGDNDIVARADSPEAAIAAMLMRHSDAAGALVAEHGVSPQRALWLLKAPMIAEAYEETFATLARENAVFIAAGSAPMVAADRPGEVFNTACVFDPERGMQVAGRKMNLVAPFETEDGLDFSRGLIEDYVAVPLPGATVGVIVCADGWAPEVAEALVGQGAEVLVQVSANPEEWSEGTRAGWQESLFSRAQECGVYGVCVMGVGNLLGLPLQGQSSVVAPLGWTDDGSGFLAEAESATDEELLVVRLDL
ncbi:MAG: carbon-nitrogen hydrolase family protein, partial [Armatimonadota bacterium]